jgi:hypothetical protein
MFFRRIETNRALDSIDLWFRYTLRYRFGLLNHHISKNNRKSPAKQVTNSIKNRDAGGVFDPIAGLSYAVQFNV